MNFWELISDAQLDFGFASGTGLGAVLLAIVLVVLFARMNIPGTNLTSLFSARRREK